VGLGYAPAVARIWDVMRRQPAELWVATAFALVLLVTYSAYLADDGLISLRYARHLARGDGLRWNRGEPPVEGYSNFLHVILGAAAIKLSLPPLAVLRAVNWWAALGVVVLVHAHARRLGCRRLTAGGAAFLVAVHPALAFWANSGLETALFTFLLLLSLHLLHERPKRWVTAVPVVLLALTRPDGAALIAILPPLLYLHHYFGEPKDGPVLRPFWRTNGRWIAAFIGVYGVYSVWRIWYFGHLLPNPVYYKADSAQPGILLAEFVDQNLPLLILAAVAPIRRLSARAWSLAAVPVLYAAILYDTVPSVSILHRFFIPAFPCAVALAAAAVEHRVVRVGARGRPTALVIFFLTAGTDLAHPDAGLVPTRARADRLTERVRDRIAVAEWIHHNTPREQPVAVADAGAIGYLLDRPVYDLFGLNDPDFVHQHGKQRRAYVRSVMRKKPKVVAVVSRDPDRFERRWGTGNHAVRSKGFADKYRRTHRVLSTTEPYHYFIYVRSGIESDSSETRAAGRPAKQLRRLRDEIGN
jgi:hypothetical protein